MDAITYDLLFDILRYEKSKEDIQHLDKEFYRKIVEYLKIKDAILLNVQTSTTERELTRIQLNNVKKILQELYERRERKIINLAIYKIKTGADIVNTDALLDEEKNMFDSVYQVLSGYKHMIIDSVLLQNVPINRNIYGITNLSGGNAENVKSVSSMEDKNSDPDMHETDSVKSIRFVRPVPRFLGPNLETYGPFEQHDIASVPGQIAKILTRKGRAEEIESN